MKVKSLSRAQLLVTPWAAAYPAAPSMGFSRQDYWSGVPLPFQLKQEASLEYQSFKESIVVPWSEEAELEV